MSSQLDDGALRAEAPASRRSGRRKEVALCIAVFLASLGFLYWRYSGFFAFDSPTFMPPKWDFLGFNWPVQQRIDVGLSQSLPDWDHGFGGGRSLLKDPQSMYWHPVPLLAAALGENARELYLVSQSLWLMVLASFMTGIFALARKSGAKVHGAVIAAATSVLFTESVATRYEIGQLNFLAGVAILPWGILAALHRPLKPNPLYPIALFCGISWMILAGPTRPTLLVAMLFGILVLYNATGPGAVHYRRRLIGSWGFAVIAALALFSPLLLANLAGVLESGRWQLGEPLGAVYSRFLMEPAAILRRLVVPFDTKPPYVEGTLYLGSALIYCSIVAAHSLTRRALILCTGLVLFCLVYAMGDETLAWPILLSHLSLLSPSSLPSRVLMLVPALLVLAPLLIVPPASKRPLGIGSLVALAFFVGGLTLAAAWADPMRAFVPLGYMIAVVAVIVLLTLGRIPKGAATTLVGLLVLFDIWGEAARTLQHRYPEGVTEPWRQISVLRVDLARLEAEVAGQPTRRSNPRQLGFGWNALIPMRILQYSDGLVLPRYDRTIRLPEHLAPIQYLGGGHHYAYVYNRFRPMPDTSSLLAELHATPFDSDELLLESADLPGSMGGWRLGSDSREALEDGDIRIGPDWVEADFQSTRSFSFLFLSMYYDAGWRAFVDGLEVDLLPAFHAFSAIPIEGAGQHHVRLEYHASFRSAACRIRAFGLAWLVLGAGFFIWKSRLISGQVLHRGPFGRRW